MHDVLLLHVGRREFARLCPWPCAPGCVPSRVWATPGGLQASPRASRRRDHGFPVRDGKECPAQRSPPGRLGLCPLTRRPHRGAAFTAACDTSDTLRRRLDGAATSTTFPEQARVCSGDSLRQKTLDSVVAIGSVDGERQRRQLRPGRGSGPWTAGGAITAHLPKGSSPPAPVPALLPGGQARPSEPPLTSTPYPAVPATPTPASRSSAPVKGTVPEACPLSLSLVPRRPRCPRPPALQPLPSRSRMWLCSSSSIISSTSSAWCPNASRRHSPRLPLCVGHHTLSVLNVHDVTRHQRPGFPSAKDSVSSSPSSQ